MNSTSPGPDRPDSRIVIGIDAKGRRVGGSGATGGGRSMVRKATGSGAWQWSRTAATRRTYLEAAREVFGEKGFADASVADVVQRSGLSVGSLYHHFGGKTELFLALWEQHVGEHDERATNAVAKARADGEDDRLELFIAGTRAFLRGSWERRDLTRLFMDGEAPPGFELMRRTRSRDWVRQNAVLLDAHDDALGHLTVSVLTVLIGEAAREIATSDSEREAQAVIEATVTLIRRLDPLSRPDQPDAS
jgi:AcrR family transcriptional regulator